MRRLASHRDKRHTDPRSRTKCRAAQQKPQREGLMRVLRTLLTALSLLSLPAWAAEDFPTKPIKLIVPFPPGGPNDIIARVVGQRMSEIAHQPVIIDNRSGQAGVLGTDAVAKSTPDGYTIGIVSSSALVISPT